MTIERKSFSGDIEVKDAEEGVVEAVFSTFDVVDSDGDIVRPGAVKDGQEILVSAYGHGSWGGLGAAMLPVGKGSVRTNDTQAIAEMKFFLATQQGKDTFETIKQTGNLQEWSYSLHDVVSEEGEENGRPVRIIKSVDIKEVSPVMKGASVDTRTLSVKSGLKFSEHIDAVLADVETLNDRAADIQSLRREKGRDISEVSQEQLGRLQAQLKALDELMQPDDEDEKEQVLNDLYIEFLAAR